MGAGKTSVGKALAGVVGCRLIDLDKLISQLEGKSIRALIEVRGETAFRTIESDVLLSVLDDDSCDVIALGGGAWIGEQNRRFINTRSCVSVWLDAPFDLCWKRIVMDRAAGRPNARDRVQAEKLYLERRTLYELASFHIEVNPEKRVNTLVSEIIAALPRHANQFGLGNPPLELKEAIS